MPTAISQRKNKASSLNWNHVLALAQSLSYTYDANGNITQIVDASQTNTAKTTTFTYDDLNRLITASTSNASSGANYFHRYNYDAIGNITSSTPSGIYVYGSSTYANPHAVRACFRVKIKKSWSMRR